MSIAKRLLQPRADRKFLTKTNNILDKTAIRVRIFECYARDSLPRDEDDIHKVIITHCIQQMCTCYI